VAVKVPPAATTAVTEARPAGAGRADSAQLAPPLAELAANGTARPAVVTAVPTATTTRPALATCSSVARVEPTGMGRSAWRQVRPPSAEVQADGWSPCEPTATKPAPPAVTAVICRSPVPSSAPPVASPPRCQPVRVSDHQTAASVRAATTRPFCTRLTFWWPTTT
jgi:hypothetical protein